MTHLGFINSFLDSHTEKLTKERLAEKFRLAKDGPELGRLSWAGLFDESLIGLSEGTPAQILEHILNKRWKLKPYDRDMIVMWHRFRFRREGIAREIQASMVVMGENSVQTAMAKTVGIPLAIAAKLLLMGKILQRGVVIPVSKEIYEPVLSELKTVGIELNEQEIPQ